MSNDKINETFVGELYFGNIDVTDLLLNGKKEIYDLDVQPYNIIVLPINNQILCANYNDKCLTLYDHKLNLIKKVDRINGEEFAPIGMVLNQKEKNMYISDYDNNRILIIDSEFNKIKSVGSTGSGDDQFLGPFDMCFQKNNLYVCDYYNKRVQVYSKDLELLKSLNVDYLTWKIEASNSKLCVESGSSGIHFYNLDDLSQYKNYNHGICRICELNSCFYEINQKSKKVFCYDNDGNLKEEVILNGLDSFINDNWDGTFIEIKGFLLMISSSKKSLVKFSKN
jgi:DNA-binding beta-propeller fold protein YncE